MTDEQPVIPRPGSRESFLDHAHDRSAPILHIIRYFAWDHLPEHLQEVSAEIAVTAMRMIDILPDSPELTVGLRKLLESKDCFVRAALEREVDV